MKRQLMISLDVIMFVLLFLLMAFHLTGQPIHEILGTTALICFIVHHVLNWKWHQSLWKGHYSTARKMITLINFLLVVDIICLGLSGILLSDLVFSFIPQFGLISLARKVHMVASYWGFVFMSIHLGFHGQMILNPIKKRVNEKSQSIQFFVFRFLPCLISIIGLFFFIKNKLYLYMFFIESFVFFDYEINIFQFIIQYLLISCLWIIIGYMILKNVRKDKKK
ncbi:MAG: DUF4405 domain-containing protein [Faecalibacillus sp.]